MARTISITQDMIKNAAFELARAEGLEAVTARRLATKAGCSTQPIFRVYSKMEELHKEVFEMAIHYFSEFYENGKQEGGASDRPFVQFGMLYIDFAANEPMLFTMLFLSKDRYGRSLYELLNGSTGAFVREMNKAKSAGVKDPGSLFMKMWIFIHGAACMSLTGDYDLPASETVKLLVDAYEKNK